MASNPRVFAGLKSGRMGFWVSPTGVDASGEAGRMVLNSDYDHLKIHQSGQLTLAGGTGPGGAYQYAPITINFPDLGFYPLTFLGSSPSTQRGLIFPAGFSNGAGVWGGSGTEVFTYISYDVFHDHIYADPVITWYPNMILTYFIFKNKLA